MSLRPESPLAAPEEPRPDQPAPQRRGRRAYPVLKMVLEFGPTVCFFIATARYNLMVATVVLMVTVVLALVAAYTLMRRVPVMPLVTAAAALVFGALTLVFDNTLFIKIKPTIVNCLFGTALLGGLAFGRPLLPVVLDSALHLNEAGWRKLTFRWGLFFFFLAALNEVVWRTQSEVFWSGFKFFGTMPITMIFAVAQVPLILRHEVKREDEQDHF